MWGLQHRTRRGDWSTGVAVGDTIPGFAVTHSERPRLLTLRGGHGFSRYELRLELDSPHPSRARVHAKTSAAFPGLHGWIYRALVIRRFVVRRLLSAVARSSEH